MPRAASGAPPAGRDHVDLAGSGRRRRSFLSYSCRRGARARRPDTAAKAIEMRISELEDHELEVLLMALRYWRSQRRDGETRRSDPPVTYETIDLLLAKLGYALAMTAPDDRPADFFRR